MFAFSAPNSALQLEGICVVSVMFDMYVLIVFISLSTLIPLTLFPLFWVEFFTILFIKDDVYLECALCEKFAIYL